MNKPNWIKIVLFICCICISNYSFSQKSRKALEQQRKELQQEIKNIKSLLSETQSQEEDLLNQLSEINLQIENQAKLIRVFKAETNALNKEILNNQKAIKALALELKTLKDDYAEMIYMSYKSNSQHSKIMFVLSSDNFYQAYQRLQYMKQYTDFRKAQGTLITAKAEELSVKNIVLENQKVAKNKLVAEVKIEQLLLEEKRKSQEDIVAQIKDKEETYIAEIEKKQKKENDLDKEIEKIIKAAIAKSNKGNKGSSSSSGFAMTAEAKLLASKFEGNKGKLPWPVEKGFVSTRFGKQNHPTLRGIVIESNGVRITTEKGATARAIFEGKVLQIQSVTGKKAIYIKHGNYITVYNNLESVYVKKGDKVSTKETIGKVYTDKISNKTILKFQIWQNTLRLNPADWIYKM